MASVCGLRSLPRADGAGVGDGAGPGPDAASDDIAGGLNYLLALTGGVNNSPKPAPLRHQQRQQQQEGYECTGAYRETTGNERSMNSSQPATTNPESTPACSSSVVPTEADLLNRRSTPSPLEEAPVKAAVEAPRRDRAESIPKWIRVGEKVCFSTVVSAVLIPSNDDMSPETKRELWWEPADFFEFRVNYARRQHGLLQDEDSEETVKEQDLHQHTAEPPLAVSPDTTVAPAMVATATPATETVTCGISNVSCSDEPTATVEGVLVLAAAPAPAPAPTTLVASPAATTNVSFPTKDAGARYNNKGCDRREFRGNGKKMYGGTAPFNRQERVGKPSAHQRDAHTRGGVGYDDQVKNMSRRYADNRRTVPVGTYHNGQRIGRASRTASSTPVVHYGGRRAQHTARGMNRGRPLSTPIGSGHFFVNGGYSGVNGHAPAAGVPYGNIGGGLVYGNGVPVAEAFVPVRQQRHIQGGGGRVVQRAMGSPYAVPPGMMMVQVPDSEQFSMWRSQLVFAPVINQ